MSDDLDKAENKQTAREAFLQLAATDPKCKLAPKSGEITVIGGARPVRSSTDAKLIALTDKQLKTVMDAAAELPVEKRAVLLERIAARLRLIGHFNDRDLELAVRAGLHNLQFSKLAHDE